MDKELIAIREYADNCHIDQAFIYLLADEGLIEIDLIENEAYFHASQLLSLERYITWHYELSVNIEGIDIIRQLLEKMEAMRNEITFLKNRLRLSSHEY